MDTSRRTPAVAAVLACIAVCATLLAWHALWHAPAAYAEKPGAAGPLAGLSLGVDEAAAEGKSVQHAAGTLVVCIDPGHGGAEKGAMSHGLVEKDLNLKISLALRDELNTYSGVRVVMTRTGDATVGLDERPAYAALQGADLFISIHCNAVGTTDGFEVWVPNWSSYYAAQRNRAHSLGYKILEELSELGRTNRGVKTRNATWNSYYNDGYPQDYYAVIRGARLRGLTGLLVEHCFLDQDGDAAVLSDDNNLVRMGIDDATAIAREYGLKKRTASATGPFKRIAGATALDTMADISTAGFANYSCPTVVLATASGYWDALSASALAGANACPVLLTATGELSSQAASEIQRLGARKAYLVGGTASLSNKVEAQVKALGVETVRLAGDKAMGTALAVYREGAGLNVEEGQADASSSSTGNQGSTGATGTTKTPKAHLSLASSEATVVDAPTAIPAAAASKASSAAAKPASVWGKTAIVATVEGYWDALASSPYAYAKRSPVFLAGTRASGGGCRLDAPTLEAIAGGGFDRVLICGGAGAVSAQVEAQLAEKGIAASRIKRLAGQTSVETSSAIAAFCLGEGFSANRTGIATADGYWDALAGSALCGKNKAPIVLVGKSNISTIGGFVAGHRSAISSGYIFGGTASVSTPTEVVAQRAAR